MPQIKCPFCGKRHTVEILYGMPSYEAFLDEKLGKIKLGGCIIMDGNPSRYCKDCYKYFGKGFEYFGIIENVFFFIGGFDGDNHFIDISLGPNSNILTHRHLLPLNTQSNPADTPTERNMKLTEKDQAYLQGIINKLYICEWPDSSIDKDILDGTQWSIEIKYQGRRKIKKHGSNKFPPGFTEFLKAMRKLSGEKL